MEDYDKIEQFKKMKLSHNQVKQLFPKVAEHDIDDIVKLLNDKLDSLKIKMSRCHPSSLSFPTVDELIEELNVYMRELTIEYDSFGLKESIIK